MLVELVVEVFVGIQVTEKLVPSVESAEGTASLAPELDIMVIAYTEVNELIDPLCPLIVAKLLPKLTVPKSASGSIPLYEEGASAIHSAELSFAPVTDVGKVV